MCKLCYIQIYDYLSLPEKAATDSLRIHEKRLRKVLPDLTKSMLMFFNTLHPLSQDCVKREVVSCVQEYVKMLRITNNLVAHQIGLIEKMTGLRLVKKIRDIQLGEWIEEWTYLFLENGVAKTKEAVTFWLGVKLMNLLPVISQYHNPQHPQEPLEMSLGLGTNTMVQKLARTVSDRDSYDELFDNDLYT